MADASKVGVFVAAVGALVASSALAVLIGARVGNWVAPRHLRIVAGFAFVAIGLWMLLAP